MNGIWLFVVLAVAIPIWIIRSGGNATKRTVAQKDEPATAPIDLSAINIRTEHDRRRFAGEGASGWGLHHHSHHVADAHGHCDGDGA